MKKTFIDKCSCCFSSDLIVYRKEKDHNSDDLDLIFSSSSDSELTQQLMICNNCSLLFVNPRFDEELIISSYENGTDEKFIKQNILRVKTFRKSLTKIIQYFNISNTSNLKLLDIGSAGGAYLLAANELGFQSEGIEPNKWLCNFSVSQYGLKVTQGVLSSNSYKPNSFDIISMWDVIEHLTNPNEVLSTINKLLVDDGKLIINYPDYSSRISKILGKYWPFWLDVHLYYFSEKTIRLILEKNGFKVIEIKRHYQLLELGYILKRIESKIPSINPITKLIDLIRLSNFPIKYYLGQKMVIAIKQ